MKTGLLEICAAIVVFATVCNSLTCQQLAVGEKDAASRAWLQRVRIAAYPLSSENAEQIVRRANESHVYGIEVDNDIPGRYESLLHPEVKLDAIKKVSVAAHAQGQKAFVYIAGLECISAHAASSHTLFKDHPQWLQRKITGEPAIFDTKAAFWIAKGEEDVWVSPYAEDWRRLYMARVRQIASTGVDGIYVDIPYWMTHFTGWEDTWASFDDATVAAFRKDTGLDAKKDIKIGDFDDPGFRKWVDFRIRTITAFLAEIRKNAVSVNPDISIIPEIYPGIEQEAVRVGADVYQIYPVVDAVSHEYEFGGGDDHTAAMRTPFDWMMYQIGIRTFRSFAGDKPTWILNYSWDGAAHVKPADAMQTLLMSELMAGANVWDARGHVMSGSNDIAQRSVIYQWIAEHEGIFGQPRIPIGEIGVYFSDTTRNYYPADFLQSYRGTVLMLLQSHHQFLVITPRTLKNFHGRALILPGVRVLSAEEAQQIKDYSGSGGRAIITGDVDSKIAGLAGAIHLPHDPARQYLTQAGSDYSGTKIDQQSPLLDAVSSGETSSSIKLTGSRNLVVHAATIDSVPYLFIANFDGLKAGEQLTPVTQINTRIEVPASFGTSMHLLPFLGLETVLQGVKTSNRVSFVVPAIDRGAVAWFK